MKEVSLYVHIPFCKQKCLYCDFPSFSNMEGHIDSYISALNKEIEKRCNKYKIKSLFIGGGTPSHLNKEQLKSLLSRLSKLEFIENAEKTIECNPGTLNKEKLQIIKDGGINRISFGLQSTKDNLLRGIGRIHNYEDFTKNFELARKVGFENINVDMMFGLPDQSLEDYIESLEKIIKLNPEHISAYSLIIEEGTPFYKLSEKNLLNMPSEEVERSMYKLGKRILEDNGYDNYEISNYAKEKRECFHNKIYWQCKEYIGVGTSASSYIDSKRLKNVDSVEAYISKINNNEDPSFIENMNTKEDDIEEFMFMGLRMTKGIEEKEFIRRFNIDVDSIYKNQIKQNIKKGLLIRSCGRIYLSDKGIELSNEVMSDMIL